MSEMMRIKEYAVKHKMSIFQVIKKIKAGELASRSVEEDGKEVTYVIVDDAKASAEDRVKKAKHETDDVQAEIAALKSEIKLLKREVAQLKKMMGGGVIL